MAKTGINYKGDISMFGVSMGSGLASAIGSSPLGVGGGSGGTDWTDYLTKGLDAAGSIGTFLGGKTRTTPETSKSGFESLPQDIKDFLLKQLFPDIKSAYSQSRPTIMKRQYTDEEANDPLTGSKARQYMQQRLNQENVPALGTGGQVAPQAIPNNQGQTMQAQELLRELAASNQGQGRKMKPMSQISIEDLMSFSPQGAQVGSGTQAGTLFGKNGQPIDLTRFYA